MLEDSTTSVRLAKMISKSMSLRPLILAIFLPPMTLNSP
jgi:hypothetical protein